MRVGFLGIQCDTANMGLAALAYSGVRIVAELVPDDADFILFSSNSNAELERMALTLGISSTRLSAVPFYHKRPAALIRSARQMRSCDLIIDFTGGDSFSDIYGTRRLLVKLFNKQMVLATGVPLVLAPQTVGPFQHRVALPWVKHVLNSASLVFTRDALSQECLEGLVNRPTTVATDVAVTLPWDADMYDAVPSGNLRVALNASGLLWNGGYTGKNQFNLRADYRAYCDGLVRILLEEGYEVHLVPHVLSRWDAAAEDDIQACRAIVERHPACILAPAFSSPVEAKSFISQMDVLVGSRMHATIASFTTGVPTVPVAYSRKFAGFFENVGYPALVDLSVLDTAAAIGKTLALVHGREGLRDDLTEGNRSAQAKIATFTAALAHVVSQ